MNINDLTEQLRGQGYFNIEDISYCYMETDGDISVLPKNKARPPTNEELGLKTEQEYPTVLVIIDGKINSGALNSLGYDTDILYQDMQKHGIYNPKEIFIAGYGNDRNFFFQMKEKVLYKKIKNTFKEMSQKKGRN